MKVLDEDREVHSPVIFSEEKPMSRTLRTWNANQEGWIVRQGVGSLHDIYMIALLLVPFSIMMCRKSASFCGTTMVGPTPSVDHLQTGR